MKHNHDAADPLGIGDRADPETHANAIRLWPTRYRASRARCPESWRHVTVPLEADGLNATAVGQGRRRMR